MAASSRGPWFVVGSSLVGLSLLGSACSMAEPIEGGGVGSTCGHDTECHAGFCDEGLCTVACTKSGDCPAPTECFAGHCAKPLNVSTFWLGGVSEGEGWNRTHQEGMVYAAAKVPYVKWTSHEHMEPAPGPLTGAIERDILDANASVIIANSFEQQNEVMASAAKHPETKFLIGAGSLTNSRNAGSYFAHMEQAVYVAGKVAAKKAKKRIGIIAALVTPEQAREIAAFTLGARSVNPEIVVEVGWLGFWLDYRDLPSFEHDGEMLFREELLAARMVESGCEVIFHQSDNQRSVRYVDKLVRDGRASNVFSIAANNPDGHRELTGDRSRGVPIPTSLGSAYYNWGPLYVRMFEQIQRGTWSPSVLVEPMLPGEDSTIGFELSPLAGLDDSVVRRFITETAKRGPAGVFEGPYETTGQRDKDQDGQPDSVQVVAAGESLAPGEFDSMCWLPKGAVEKADPLDPHSLDVDAHVPNPGFLPPSDLLGPPGTVPGKHLTCDENR